MSLRNVGYFLQQRHAVRLCVLALSAETRKQAKRFRADLLRFWQLSEEAQ
jgi:hypothetical protein